MSILTAPTVVTVALPFVTFTTTLQSGYNLASASAELASLTAAATVAAATATATHTTQGSSGWPFVPVLAPSVIATALYGLVTIGLTFRLFQFRTWFMIPLILGTIMETLGFGARSQCVEDLSNVTLYKMELSCTILAPIFTAAAEYIVLGRLMQYVGRRFSFFRPSFVSWIFVTSDIISFLIQVAGAAVLLARSTPKTGETAQQVQNSTNLLNLGDNILLGGLGVNLGSFAIFFLQIFYFHRRTLIEPAPSSPKSWRTLLWVVYVSAFFVLVRQIYRVIEFSQGWFGYLPTHEVYFYCFDSLPILIASAIYVYFWPTKHIPGDWRVRLAKETGEEYIELSEKDKQRLSEEGSLPTSTTAVPVK